MMKTLFNLLDEMIMPLTMIVIGMMVIFHIVLPLFIWL